MSYQNIEIKPIAGRIGAKINGVNLAEKISDEIISEIRKALVEYKVIFFRGQELDANGQGEHLKFVRTDELADRGENQRK